MRRRDVRRRDDQATEIRYHRLMKRERGPMRIKRRRRRRILLLINLEN